nr:hypothetical protein [Tanacetum cinerariifolium]
MANLSKDIQCVGFDTRPPMLDRTDFASWQQRIRLYCRGKENGVNNLKSIDEGPYQIGTVRETLAESTEGAPQFGPERSRVYLNLSPEEKDQYNADIRATNILLQGLPKDIYTLINHYTDAKDIWDNVKMLLEGAELIKEDQKSQLYDDFKHFRHHKGESIHDYYVRFAKLINDMRNIKMTMSRMQLNSKFVNNMLPEWGQARPGQARPVKCYNCNGIGHIARNYTQPMRPQNSKYYKDKMLLMQAQENGVALDVEQLLFLAGGQDNAFDDDAPTTQTMFMANLSSADPVTDEAGPSYDSDILSEVHDHDHYQDATCVHHEEHVMHDSVQLDHFVDSHADYTSDSNMIPYNQYLQDNEVPIVHSDVSSIPNDAFMMIYNDMCDPHAQSISKTSRNTAVKNSLIAELATYKEQVKLPKPYYNELNKVVIGYKNPLCLTCAKQVQLALYNGPEIIKDNHAPAIVHNTKDTLEIAEITRKKMNAKMNDPECVTRKVKITPHDYSKENFLATFTPQKQLTPKQIFWSNDLIKLKFEALKEQTTVSRPIKVLTVYPPNTHATLVPKVLPTKKLNVAQFTKMHVANTIVEARCLALEAELANLRNKSHHDNHEELINHFSKFEVNHLNLQLKYQNLKDSLGNNPPTPDKDTPDFDSVFVINKMQASLQGKDNVIRQLKRQLSQLQVTRSDTDRTLKVQTADSQITKLTEQVTNLQAQNNLFRAENDKIKQHYKELYDSIKITRAKHIEPVTNLTTANVNLKARILKQGNSVSKDQVKPKVLAREKHVIDVEPIVPRLRNNKDAHLDYLRHLKESVEIIRNIIEEAKVVRPLDRSIVSACRYTKHFQELLEYAIGTCPQGSQQRAKQLSHIPLIRKKQVSVAKPSDKSDSNIHKHVVTVKTQKTNVHVPPSIGVNSCPNASGSQPKSNTKTNRISPAKGVNKIPVEDQPRTNKSHLKTSNRVDSSSHLQCAVVQIVLWYLDSGCSKHMTRDRSRLMNFVKKFIRTVRFGNDHFGAIMGYGDYVIGDSVISRKTVPRTPQQNGVVERWNRTLIEAARTMLEGLQAFMDRFKAESAHIKGVPLVLRISAFMHGHGHPELAKKLNDKILKTVDEMWERVMAFIKGEMATDTTKAIRSPWWEKSAGKTSWLEGQNGEGFTPLMNTPKEILAMDNVNFLPPPLMVGTLEKRKMNKFCDYHQDRGHNTNDCYHLKKYIEEAVASGRLAHMVKDIRQGGQKSKGSAKGQEKVINMVRSQGYPKRPYERVERRMDNVITFASVPQYELMNCPLVMYEHCLRSLSYRTRSRLRESRIPLVGFSREVSYPMGVIDLEVTVGECRKTQTVIMEFAVVKIPSSYNALLGRTRMRSLGAVASTTHSMMKFPTSNGISTISTIRDSKRVQQLNKGRKPSKAGVEEKIVVNDNYQEQLITIGGGGLSAECIHALMHTLRKNVDIFAWTSTDMTDRRKVVTDEVSEWLKAGIVRRVRYPTWVANPVLVKKVDGSWRMYIDFKDLNKAYPKDLYPLQKIDWKIEWLDEEKTTFYTEERVFCYTKMPFGLKNAGATYQRLVDSTFKEQIRVNLEAYVDDMVIKSRTEQDILKGIEQTFSTLRRINMKLNPKKCSFGMEERKFLGYIVTSKGIRANPEKEKAIMEMPSPKTHKQMQSLSGKLEALNRFLSKSAERSLPFLDTLKKCTNKKVFRWTEADKAAFLEMKKLVSKLPTLTTPKKGETLMMHLAASNEAVSAVLLTERDGRQMPIHYVSRSLQGAKTNYSSMEKLALALVHAARRLRRYFQVHPIKVITDSPIGQVLNNSGASRRLVKWAVELGAYGIMYVSKVAIKGQVLAEFLANTPIEINVTSGAWRLYIDRASNNEGSKVGLILMAPDDVEYSYALRFNFSNSNTDVEYEALLAGLRIAKEMQVKYIHAFVDSKLVASQVNALSKLAVAQFDHLSKEVLVEVLNERSIEAQEVNILVEEEGLTWMTTIRNCLEEGKLLEDPVNARTLMEKIRNYTIEDGILEVHMGSCGMHDGPRQTFMKWGMDIVGSLPEGPERVKYLIVAIDYFTKWMEAKPLATITGKQVVNFAYGNIVCRFGIPATIIIDNGTQFVNDHFKKWAEKLKIKLISTLVYHPQGNGAMERANKSLLRGIKTRLEKG